MLKQTPIILQATLLENELKLRGIADIIIRSDYINKLFKEPVLKDSEIFHNNKLYYFGLIASSKGELYISSEINENNEDYEIICDLIKTFDESILKICASISAAIIY